MAMLSSVCVDDFETYSVVGYSRYPILWFAWFAELAQKIISEEVYDWIDCGIHESYDMYGVLNSYPVFPTCFCWIVTHHPEEY